jgi:hypothetical protein
MNARAVLQLLGLPHRLFLACICIADARLRSTARTIPPSKTSVSRLVCSATAFAISMSASVGRIRKSASVRLSLIDTK